MAEASGFVPRTKRQVKCLFDWLERPKHVRALVLSHVRIFSVHARIKQYFDKTFGPEAQLTTREAQLDKRRLKLFDLDDVSKHSTMAITTASFPTDFEWYVFFRAFTTVWQVYVIIRYLLGKQIGYLIGVIRGKPLEHPIGCYLMGRYIIGESVAEMTAAAFSAGHLSWRFTQWIASAYRMNFVYFLLIAESELERAHARLESPGASIKLAPGEIDRVDLHEKLILETLCFKISKAQAAIYKIRPNRGRTAHLKLRRLLVKYSLVAWLFILGVTILLTISFTFMIVTDERFLRLYPNCDPHMERVKAQGKITFWSVNVTPYRIICGIMDGLENVALWWDGGTWWTLGPVFIYFLNYDLVLQWEAIQSRIDQLRWNLRHSEGFEWCKHTDELLELEALMMDFFEQVRMANVFLSNFLNGSMSYTLALCAAYSYFFQNEHLQQMPLGAGSVFVHMICALSICCNGFLIVNRHCHSSYARLCSLIALESSRKNKYALLKLLDFFESKRSCFTLLHNYPFEATTFMTIIGWAFSCFFVVTNMMQRSSPAN